MDSKLNLKAGDVVMYGLFGKVRIDTIMSIDDRIIECYDHEFDQYTKISIDYYDGMFIGKVHPTLVKLWQLDKLLENDV